MEIETSTSNYIIRRAPSIFPDRQSKEDIYIKRRNNDATNRHGSRESDGYYYNLVAVFAQETGEAIRLNEPLPIEISYPLLCQRGFLSIAKDPCESDTIKSSC